MATSITTDTSSDRMASRNRSDSVSECTGFALSMIIARMRSGWSVSTSLAIELQGVRPEMISAPVTGVYFCRLAPPPPDPSCDRLVWGNMPPGLPKLPVRIHNMRCK